MYVKKIFTMYLLLYFCIYFFVIYFLLPKHGRISSVGRVLDRRAGGCRFDSQDRTNTQGLKITEK